MKRIVSVTCAAALSVCAHMAYAGSYDDFSAVLVDAIDHGSAFGALRGPVANSLITKLHANGPVYVTARPIGDLPRPGCRRLDVLFDIRGVQTAVGETSGRLDVKMNYCRDRVPPIGLTSGAAVPEKHDAP
ncbi:hypothetical protein D1006_40895 [Burkholderia stabilis]|uniref:Lipoprotein n=2 Tax=Burkholderia cepacia complex TaxID=87882 RepID=A0A4Q2A659_9BURK|nr:MULTISPECIES: hypothetical protein [Burkholderia cepacia complex]KML57039.1 hypothetical protein VL15_15045 [Burkholderia cepacia]RXV64161.1 hypothetical protein D1006_40895 [Burkholderia stabilis]